MKTLKCVVVGDGYVGKTCLLIRYGKDEYPTDYIPTVFDSYAVSIPVKGETYELHLCDTAGQEEYDQLRKGAYLNVDIFLVCFSIDEPSSFTNAREMWVPELRKYCPGVPYILVGTKIDLRSDQETIKKLASEKESPITKSQGETLAKQLQAVKYVECSALKKVNVDDVFQEAIFAALPDSDNSAPISKVKVNPTGAYYNPGSTSSSNNKNQNSNNGNNVSAPEKDDNSCCCLLQ